MLEKERLVFHPITMEDREWMTQKLQEEAPGACEYTFANNFIWSEVYQVEVGQAYGCGVVRYRESGTFEYSFPFGNGDKKKVIRMLREICAAHQHELCLYPIEEKHRRQLIEWFPGEFEIDEDRSDFDYVYTVEKLSTLRGSKLHGKRNHIARFMDDQDWNYERLTPDQLDGCREMAKLWVTQREEKWNEQMEQEVRVLDKALTYFEELGLVGGVLRKKGEIVAFTIGEALNSDTLVVHFEKAFPEIQGAYPMINQQFVLHEGSDFSYVNREEDADDPGLRRAKLSYCPDHLLKKYRAVESNIVYANELQQEEIIDLWQTCFGDSREYIQMYLEHRFELDNMMVIFEDGRPVSMASFLPVFITINGRKEKARYVYAVATLPEYRKKGYASELIRHGLRKYEEPLLLQPAGDELEQFYESMGFEKVFSRREYRCKGNGSASSLREFSKISEIDLGEWDITPVFAAEYKRIRDAHFEGEGYVEWDEKAIAYAIRENAFFGGETLKFTYGSREELLMYDMDQGEINIRETTMTEAELATILPEIAEKMEALGVVMWNTGGMILLPSHLSWEEKRGYLNLTLG